MPTLTLTRGLPGSGKTTWARQQRAVRVNRDDLRLMLHGGRMGAGWAEMQVTIAQRAQVDALLRAGVDVICDDTNLRAQTVRELAELGAAAGAQVKLEDFTGVPVDVCVERDATRPNPVGEEVIRTMYARYLAGKRRPVELPPGPAESAVYVPPPGKPSAILVDIDGTVAVMSDRSPYDMTRVHMDSPNEPVIATVRAMQAAGHTIIFCSGRTDDGRAATEAWLQTHVGVPHAGLFMRATGDQRKDSVVKREIFEKQLRDHWRIQAVFDDRNQVVRMWRELGLPVFQVAEGNF